MRKAKSKKGARDPQIVVLRRERDALAQTIKGLEKKLAVYEEKYQILLYNKALGAVGAEALKEPLPKKSIVLDERERHSL